MRGGGGGGLTDYIISDQGLIMWNYFSYRKMESNATVFSNLIIPILAKRTLIIIMEIIQSGISNLQVVSE